jgi:hypothetical protein
MGVIWDKNSMEQMLWELRQTIIIVQLPVDVNH